MRNALFAMQFTAKSALNKNIKANASRAQRKGKWLRCISEDVPLADPGSKRKKGASI